MTTTTARKWLSAGLVIHRAAGDEAEITITTPARDLMRDVVEPLGMDTSRYLGGTRAVNYAHQHDDIDDLIGKTVALSPSRTGIRARFRWLDSNPKVPRIRAAFAAGVLGASIEFIPTETARLDDGGWHYVRSVLTGWALTPSPANPACARVLRSLGLTDRDGDAELDIASIPYGDAEIDLAAIPSRAVAGADVLVSLSPHDVQAAIRATVPGMVRDALRRELARARGRVD